MKRLAVVACTALALAVAFTSGAEARVAEAAGPDGQAWESNSFSSPTGNIRCREFVRKDFIACLTLNDHWAIGVPLSGKAWIERNVSARQFPHGPTLWYGEKWRDPGRFRCTSTRAGMSCWSIPSGHGFFTSRDRYRLW